MYICVSHHLFGVQRADWRLIIDLDPATLLVVAVVKRRLPSAFAFWDREPQPHQMPPHPRPALLIHAARRMILIRRPRVEDMRIAQQLDVARVEDHMQRQLRARIVQNLKRALLLLRQRWNPGVGTGVEAFQRGHVVGVEFGPDARGARRVVLHEDDAGSIPRVLAFADLTFAVEVPVGRG